MSISQFCTDLARPLAFTAPLSAMPQASLVSGRVGPAWAVLSDWGKKKSREQDLVNQTSS